MEVLSLHIQVKAMSVCWTKKSLHIDDGKMMQQSNRLWTYLRW